MKKDIPIPAEIFYDKRLGHSERMVLRLAVLAVLPVAENANSLSGSSTP